MSMLPTSTRIGPSFRPIALTGRRHLEDGRRYVTHEIVSQLLSDLTCAGSRTLRDRHRCASFGRTECPLKASTMSLSPVSRSRGISKTHDNSTTIVRTCWGDGRSDFVLFSRCRGRDLGTIATCGE